MVMDWASQGPSANARIPIGLVVSVSKFESDFSEEFFPRPNHCWAPDPVWDDFLFSPVMGTGNTLCRVGPIFVVGQVNAMACSKLGEERSILPALDFTVS